MKNVVYEVIVNLRGNKGNYCVVNNLDEAIKEAYRRTRKLYGRLEFIAPVLKVTITKCIKNVGRSEIAVIYPARIHNYKKPMVYDD